MPNDQGPVVQSALLRNELVRLRRESGLTQEQVAQNLDWSPSKLIRVEGGRSSITKVDLDALLTMYGITSESQREQFQDMNRRAREPDWWSFDSDKSYSDEIQLKVHPDPITRSSTLIAPAVKVVACRDCVRRGNTKRAPGAGRRMPANLYRDSACA